MVLARRQFLHFAGATGASLALPWSARAQTYPARPVRLIVPFAPGGSTDVLARLVAQKFSERLGRQFFVENQAGAGGNIGMGAAAKASADGHTILVVSSSFVINPSLYAKVPYNPVEDFAPVTVLATSPIMLVVNPSFPATNMREFITLVKANPGKYSYASPGTGNALHLAGERLKSSFGLDLVHVPFNGGAPSMTSTIAGHTPIALATVVTAAPHLRAGSLRALAVMSTKRASALPSVPTMMEAGFVDQEADNLTGMLVPARTPKEIIAVLHHESVRAIALPDVKERLTALGFDPVGGTAEEFAAQIKTEIVRWQKVIRDANISRVE
jgi:tripartite-type tricarboxylate transporter receptor subunit TctC